MSRIASNPKTARLSVSLDEQTYRTICDIARADDVSVAWVIRRAVNDLVKNRDAVSSSHAAGPISRTRTARGR
ncbi:hypothetical protein DLM45_05405 [Hyphomicrobium methylovorum]|uniref:ribbon-helix-helix protein, CopG family n=1 Tax=Hyphomicrobium methylovorum TaxID=84 RepID=UPI0015E6A4D6|nr:ribbon-helix-helix protein, CopG family [Hyphomicrobium methylovorum]MBA2125660.1 hypothetical protein [Hyphomicrobium methylovorum]